MDTQSIISFEDSEPGHLTETSMFECKTADVMPHTIQNILRTECELFIPTLTNDASFYMRTATGERLCSADIFSCLKTSTLPIKFALHIGSTKQQKSFDPYDNKQSFGDLMKLYRIHHDKKLSDCVEQLTGSHNILFGYITPRRHRILACHLTPNIFNVVITFQSTEYKTNGVPVHAIWDMMSVIGRCGGNTEKVVGYLQKIAAANCSQSRHHSVRRHIFTWHNTIPAIQLRAHAVSKKEYVAIPRVNQSAMLGWRGRYFTDIKPVPVPGMRRHEATGGDLMYFVPYASISELGIGPFSGDDIQKSERHIQSIQILHILWTHLQERDREIRADNIQMCGPLAPMDGITFTFPESMQDCITEESAKTYVMFPHKIWILVLAAGILFVKTICTMDVFAMIEFILCAHSTTAAAARSPRHVMDLRAS